MTDKKTVNIDLKKLGDLAHTGVRRAALFMGLGLNAAHREDFNDYELCKLPIAPEQTSLPIDFFPSNLPAERVGEFKKQFALWVIGCGLRELLEHYALFLDHIHKNALLVFLIEDKLGSVDPEKKQEEFNQRLGIPDKLERLKKMFSISPDDPESIKSLYLARNCLTHNFGIVTQRQCGPDESLTLTWKTLDVIAKGEETGIERPLTELIGLLTEEETSIFTKTARRERKFALGEKIQLSQQDLWEICFFFNAYAIPSAVQSFIEFLEAHGIPVKVDNKKNASNVTS